MKPLVSILIPCHNATPWLVETLKSALAQTWFHKEIIVVDDGSTDYSLKIAQSFESYGVKVISQLNKGASAARNRALRESRGDFIQYLDADDLLAPNKIEHQVGLLEDSNSDCVATGEWARFYNSPTEANFIPEPVWNDMSPVEWLICSWLGGGMMHPAAWLVPRSIANRAGFWNESLSLNDDGEYFCRVVLASKGVKFCPGAKSYYRSGISNSLSSLKSYAAQESVLRSIELCTNYLLARENTQRTRHACATVFQRFIYSVYSDMPDLIQKAEVSVKSLGGSNLKLSGSTLFQFLSNTVGWKRAKRIQKFARHYSLKQNYYPNR